MSPRPLGNTGLSITPIGFGAVKIGRNVGVKYKSTYGIPDDAAAAALLNRVLDLGINHIDTAPAYGLSEARIGAALHARRSEFVLSTKVGETFSAGRSTFDFSSRKVRLSLAASLLNLRTDFIDIAFIHSDGNDLAIQRDTDCVAALQNARQRGSVRAIGISSKTVEGAREAIKWADVLMIEYHLSDRSHEAVIAEAAQRGVGVIVKKGLASGQLPAEQAIPFVLKNPGVCGLVVGSLSPQHLESNIAIARAAAG